MACPLIATDVTGSPIVSCIASVNHGRHAPAPVSTRRSIAQRRACVVDRVLVEHERSRGGIDLVVPFRLAHADHQCGSSDQPACSGRCQPPCAVKFSEPPPSACVKPSLARTVASSA